MLRVWESQEVLNSHNPFSPQSQPPHLRGTGRALVCACGALPPSKSAAASLADHTLGSTAPAATTTALCSVWCRVYTTIPGVCRPSDSLTSVAHRPQLPLRISSSQFQGFNFFLHSTFSFRIRWFCFHFSYVFAKNHLSSLGFFFLDFPLRPLETWFLRVLLFSGTSLCFSGLLLSSLAMKKVKVRMRCGPKPLAARVGPFSVPELQKPCFPLTEWYNLAPWQKINFFSRKR